jgi:hypothetical protein
LAVALCACRAPGEPPHRPAPGEYRDLIRRELDSVTSALVTVRITLDYYAHGRLPTTYAKVVVRQARRDLEDVEVDLRQVVPPVGARKAQDRLLLIARRDRVLFDNLGDHWTASARARVLGIAAVDANTVKGTLSKALDP